MTSTTRTVFRDERFTKIESACEDLLKWIDEAEVRVIYPSSPAYISDDEARESVVLCLDRQRKIAEYIQRAAEGTLTAVESRPGAPI